jgi:hypothetical protein
VIRNAVVHLTNEQPLLADLFSMPSSDDAGLVCTNIRMLDGKKPVFVDHSDSVFIFPYLHIRFVEVLAAEAAGLPALPAGETYPDAPEPSANGSRPDAEPEPEADLELDEDFLRRIRDV